VGVLPKEERQRDGCCRADKALRVRVQRSVGSSSQVREMKKNLAYQPARDPLIWAAYMPRKVGPLGGKICKYRKASNKNKLISTAGPHFAFQSSCANKTPHLKVVGTSFDFIWSRCSQKDYLLRLLIVSAFLVEVLEYSIDIKNNYKI